MRQTYSSRFSGKAQPQVVLPAEPIFSKVGPLFSYRQAAQLGLKSRTAWSRDGFTLIPDATPAGFVVTDSSRVYRQCVQSEVACLREITDSIVEVVSSDQGYLVYSKDQTRPKRKRRKQNRAETQISAEDQFTTSEIQETNSSFYFLSTIPSTPPHHTPPYVIETNNTANNDPGVATGVWLTVPKDLPIPESHRHLENEIYYYCHTILQGEFNKKHDRDKTTRINRKLMQSILGNASKETQARQWLLEDSDPKIIYTDHVYSQGNFSKSYGVNPLYRTPLMRWQVTNPRLAHRLRLARLRRLDIKREQEERQS